MGLHIDNLETGVTGWKNWKKEEEWIYKLFLFLKNHINTFHLNKREYVCDLCGKAFIHNNDLRRHRSTVHEGLKNFKCDQCDKAFGSQGTLKTHVTYVHESTRNHICDSCGKAFATTSGLSRHVLNVHKGVKRPRPSSSKPNKIKKEISAFHSSEFM